MSTLLLLILFAFLGFALWIGYKAYGSMQKKRGPVPPAKKRPGAQPAEQARPEGAKTHGNPQPDEGATTSESATKSQPPRREAEAGPQRPDKNERRS